jgi:hypothetical protein
MIGRFEREARLMLSFFDVLLGAGLLVVLIAPKIVAGRRAKECLDRGGQYYAAGGECTVAAGKG